MNVARENTNLAGLFIYLFIYVAERFGRNSRVLSFI